MKIVCCIQREYKLGLSSVNEPGTSSSAGLSCCTNGIMYKLLSNINHWSTTTVVPTSIMNVSATELVY